MGIKRILSNIQRLFRSGYINDFSPAFKDTLAANREKDDVALLEVVYKTMQSDIDHIAAQYELDRRNDWRRFWRQDLVAWLALVLAVLALVFDD